MNTIVDAPLLDCQLSFACCVPGSSGSLVGEMMNVLCAGAHASSEYNMCDASSPWRMVPFPPYISVISGDESRERRSTGQNPCTRSRNRSRPADRLEFGDDDEGLQDVVC